MIKFFVECHVCGQKKDAFLEVEYIPEEETEDEDYYDGNYKVICYDCLNSKTDS